MSDFFNNGWSIYIAVATLVGLLACLVLMIIAARRRVMAADNTTGHVWDGDLRELNNPLPRWWMWLFVATVLFAVGYLLLYPGLGNAAGWFGWSSTSAHRDEQARARQLSAPLFSQYAAVPAEQLARNPSAMLMGERLFANNCAACHGADARGSKGFPDLTDRDWLWGGTPAQIAETIAKGRQGQMPRMADAVGSPADVVNVANYVLSLSGSAHNGYAAYDGKSKFRVCAGCHGVDGKGNPAMGAPNLTDDVWLHGWGESNIVSIVNRGKTNIMPAHAERLTPEQIHVLSAYVWRLSNRDVSLEK